MHCQQVKQTLQMKPIVAGYLNDFTQIDFIATFRMAGNALNVGFV